MSQVDEVYASPRYGFGSSESLGVIGVVCVVAFGLLTWSAVARDRAREQACASNVTQIVRAMALYSGDHGGWFPAESVNTIAAIMPYIKNHDIFRCPGDAEPLEAEYSGESGYSSEPQSASSGQTLELSYFLVGGLSSDDRPSTILVGDSVARHRSRANASCIDGRLVSLSSEELSVHVGGESDGP